MEFWGVEVKVGEKLKCEVEDGKVLHLSQAALGDSKNQGSESVPIFVNFNDQKLVLGTLSQEKCAQIQYDLVFEKQFELSHTSKNASVYFCGYKSSLPDEFPSSDEFSDSDEDVQIAPSENGKVKVKNELGKPGVVKANASKEDNSAAKAKVKKEGSVKAKPKEELKAEPKASDDDDEDEDDKDDVDGEDDSDDEDMLEAMGDSDDDEDDSSDDEDEATPKKAAASGQKRPAGSAAKTPVPEKRAKVISPAGGQKTGGDKKSAHIATPYPKQTGKTPANSAKSKQQSPKSTGSVSCKACSKSFNSENALQAHSKAKHSSDK